MPRRHKAQNVGWLATLTAVVGQKPLALFRFGEPEWQSLKGSRRGTNAFTIAYPFSSLENVRAPTACLLIGREVGRGAEVAREFADDTEVARVARHAEVAHFALLKSRSPITTVDSRLKITGAQPVSPSTEAGLLGLVTDKALNANFRARLAKNDSVIRLSPALSVHLVERLAERPENRHALRVVSESLGAPASYSGNLSLQGDAVALALKAFGLSADETAASVKTTDDKETVLARVSVREDAVIEHDARVVPGFSLSTSDLTGRAVFRKGNEVLEIITANKRPLERVLGVDLIYLNAVKQNVVMVQYKMLTPNRKSGATDWLYRPDGQLQKEIARMRRFSRSHEPGPLEYRINPQVFYLRFVRKDAALGQSAVTMPIDHFEVLRGDPACKGPKGAFRISFDTLDGRYLRQDGFLDLVNAGYIGAYANTTNDLANLIRATLKEGRAVVAAVQAVLS